MSIRSPISYRCIRDFVWSIINIGSSGAGGGGGGTGGGGGGGLVQNYLNIADAASYASQPARAAQGSGNIGTGGFMPGVNNGYASGGAGSVHACFWFRLNEQIQDGETTPLFAVYNHDHTFEYASTYGIFLVRNTGGTSGLKLRWARKSPWYNEGVYTIPAASLPKLFESAHTVYLNKWIFIWARMGSSVGAYIGDEDGRADWVAGGSPSAVADRDPGVITVGTIGGIRYSGNNDEPGTPRMDFCNLRVGLTTGPSAAWWSNNWWKRQIDTTAEWAEMTNDGYTLTQAKQAVSYGYPLQDDLTEESGIGGDFALGASTTLTPVVGDGPPLVEL